jgi:hypothetical protein
VIKERFRKRFQFFEKANLSENSILVQRTSVIGNRLAPLPLRLESEFGSLQRRGLQLWELAPWTISFLMWLKAEVRFFCRPEWG